MSLIDELRESIAALPPSHIPTVSEALPIIGALIAYAEHGHEYLEAAKQHQAAVEAGDRPQAIDNLFAPPDDQVSDAPVAAAPAPAPVSPAPAPAADPRAEELAAENAALQQQVQTLLANQQRTGVSVEPSSPPAPADPSTQGQVS